MERGAARRRGPTLDPSARSGRRDPVRSATERGHGAGRAHPPRPTPTTHHCFHGVGPPARGVDARGPSRAAPGRGAVAPSSRTLPNRVRRAALARVLVRVLDGLSHITRLQKQHEENRLRADLTPADDAHLVLAMKSLKDIEVAERLLTEASVQFEALADKQVKSRGELVDHLECLKRLLLARSSAVASLSPWRETEQALGISEAARKRKLSVLRLEPEILAEANGLPANHATLIAQVEDRQRRAELVEHAPYLTNRQLNAAVRRLRGDSDLSVEAALKRPEPVSDPLAFEQQLSQLADLCRQMVRLLGNLWPRTSEAERDEARKVLTTLVHTLHEFEEAA